MRTQRLLQALSCVGSLAAITATGLTHPAEGEEQDCTLSGKIQPARVRATIWGRHLPTNRVYKCKAAPDGSFRLVGPPGKYEIGVSPPAPYAPFQSEEIVEVAPGETLELPDIVLAKEGVIKGRVAGCEAGMALSALRNRGLDVRRPAGWAKLDAEEKEFRIGRLEPGAYSLAVVAPGRAVVAFVPLPAGAKPADAGARQEAADFAVACADAMVSEDWGARIAMISRGYSDSLGRTSEDVIASLRASQQAPPAPTKYRSVTIEVADVWVAEAEFVCLARIATQLALRASGQPLGDGQPQRQDLFVWRLAREDNGVIRVRGAETLVHAGILRSDAAMALGARPEDPVMASTPVMFRFSAVFADIEVRAGETTRVPDLDVSEFLPPAEE